MPDIPITGMPSSFRTPGTYVEALFGQGASSAPAGARTVALCMPKLAASGSWTAATLYGPIKNEDEAISGAGSGSPLHRGVRKYLAKNRNSKLYVLPYLPSVGAGGTSATGTITIAGAASGSGILEVDICGETCSVGIKNLDAAADIGANLIASINAKSWLPMTASGNAVVTLTAKIIGASQNGIYRMRARITDGITTTATCSAATVGTAPGVVAADGATTEATQLSGALATIGAVRRYYIGLSVNDATCLGHLKTHIVNKSEPKVGMRSCGVYATTGALAASSTIANTLNYERIVGFLQINGEWDPATMVGQALAVMQKRYEVDSTFNFDDYGTGNGDWDMPKAYATADWPDLDDCNDAINDGLTIIKSHDAGSSICMLCNTRSKNTAGTVDDFRATEFHRVSGVDEFLDTWVINHQLTYGAKKIKPDKLLVNGKVDTNQKLIRDVVTPSAYRPFPMKLIDDFEDAGKLKFGDQSKESLACAIDPQNAGRLECGLNLYIIDHFHQLTVRGAESSTG